ncbi:AgrD family cyclic lactone autoinducer peptide [Metabacillus idriensis]
MKFLSTILAVFSLFVSSFSSLSSCFWFAHEPQLPKDKSDEK